jgi:hypothetical protein
LAYAPYQHDVLTDAQIRHGLVFVSPRFPGGNEQVISARLVHPKNNSIEIIVVDDHSTDNSSEEIKAVRDHQNINLLADVVHPNP